MFAVKVKPASQRFICNGKEIWVKDATFSRYVSIKERGLWETKEEAEKAKTEPWEIVVEVKPGYPGETKPR